MRPRVIEDVVLADLRRDRPRRVDLGVGTDGRVAWIVPAGRAPRAADGWERTGSAGLLALPAFAVGHHHLYSTFAPGMPAPARPPTNFLEILERVWWKLDTCFDPETIRLSGLLGAMSAARHGAGTVIDHHASPGCIPGSLAALAEGVERVGLRGVYCYEVTDRHGEAEAEAGIAENLAFLDRCARAPADPAGPRRAGLLGAHASFTLGDRTLDLLASRAEYGLHIHIAEDPADAALSRQRYGAAPLARLARRGLLGPRTLLAHGVHLRPRELETIAGSGATLVHCYRSNLNNSVGLPPAAAAAAAGIPLALGTDGMDGSLLDELKAAFYAHQAEALGQGYAMAARYLDGNAALVARHLPGVELREVARGRPADLTLWRYPAAGAMLPGRTLGHLLFGLSPARLHATMVGGRFVYRDGRYPLLGDPEPLLAEARARMRSLWRRMASPPRPARKTRKRGPA